MVERVWLHIGSEKTGSTSIQGLLRRNRQVLARRGVLVPQAAGLGNQMALCAYGLGGRVRNVLGTFPETPDDASVPRFRARLERELEAEVAAHAGADVVFSNEHCSSRLLHTEEVARLKGLCDRVGTHTRVVFYVRNQADLAVSWYSTAVKTGSTMPFQWPPGELGAHMLEFRALLERWMAVFGPGNVLVRRFVPVDFVGGDLLSDFASVVGFTMEGLVRPPAANRALDARCLMFLRAFNAHVPRLVDGTLNPLRGRVMRYLEQVSGGAPYVIAPGVAREIMATYADTNAWVSRTFFGGAHAPLFPPPRYVAADEAYVEPPLEAGDAVAVAASLWAASMRDKAERRGGDGRR